MEATVQDIHWIEELEKTVISSLTTSFGLDFLLFKDSVGGNVDTIHNARAGIWATDAEKQAYEHREKYDSKPYHNNEAYVNRGKADQSRQAQGDLRDPYRNTAMRPEEDRDLDHVISAKEIHDDPGRSLSGCDGVDLANQDSNLQSTHRSVNRSKKQLSVKDFLEKLPERITAQENKLAKDQQRLADMPRETPEQQHKARELEDNIRKDSQKLSALKAVDPEEMAQRDAKARASYDQKVNYTYYTSSKFLGRTAHEAGKAGLRMGTRQALGMVLAEMWFELRTQLPVLLEELKREFNLEVFIERISATLKGIWQRVQARFSKFLLEFKNGVFAGILGSLSTTIFNIFATTEKMAIKIIREVWGQMVKAIKLLIFNPDNLSFVELCQAVTSLLSVAAGTVMGSVVYAELLPICNFPFGAELATFASALVTGVTTLGISYCVLYSPIARNIWTYLDSLMPHAGTIRQFQAINAELDRYLTELSQLEFNLDMAELRIFTEDLQACNDELALNSALGKEISARGIKLPFEMGNLDSTRDWLSSFR